MEIIHPNVGAADAKLSVQRVIEGSDGFKESTFGEGMDIGAPTLKGHVICGAPGLLPEKFGGHRVGSALGGILEPLPFDFRVVPFEGVNHRLACNVGPVIFNGIASKKSPVRNAKEVGWGTRG